MYTYIMLCYLLLCTIASEKPTARELSVYFKPYAQQWFDIGILLDLPLPKLEDIAKRHKDDVQSCGVRMLMEWVVSDPNACWKKLQEVVENITKNTDTKPTISGVHYEFVMYIII